MNIREVIRTAAVYCDLTPPQTTAQLDTDEDYILLGQCLADTVADILQIEDFRPTEQKYLLSASTLIHYADRNDVITANVPSPETGSALYSVHRLPSDFVRLVKGSSGVYDTTNDRDGYNIGTEGVWQHFLRYGYIVDKMFRLNKVRGIMEIQPAITYAPDDSPSTRVIVNYISQNWLKEGNYPDEVYTDTINGNDNLEPIIEPRLLYTGVTYLFKQQKEFQDWPTWMEKYKQLLKDYSLADKPTSPINIGGTKYGEPGLLHNARIAAPFPVRR